MSRTSDDLIASRPLSVQTIDGYLIKGFEWRHGETHDGARTVVIINAATSVCCRYYSRFADFLFHRGFDVITYDYRGIGESRPATLRGFKATWRDWGQLDFEAILRYANQTSPGRSICVVGHSVGGLILGLAPSSHLICRIFTVGAQIAYWRDYAAKHKWRMFWSIHVFMPVAAALLGYFPGKRLGWFEDTPKGVVRDWHRLGSDAMNEAERSTFLQPCAAVAAPILALSATDDPYGTAPAIERLLKYFANSTATRLFVSPESIGETAIGHFAFFNSRFETTLWLIALQWLRHEPIVLNFADAGTSEVSGERVATTDTSELL